MGRTKKTFDSIRRSARFVAFGFLLVLAAGLWSPLAAADDARIRLAVDYLIQSQRPDGLFTYDFDFLKAAESGDDHFVRQTGAAYVLAEYYLLTRDERLRAPITAALEAFDRMSVPLGRHWAQSVVEWTGLLSLPFGRYKLRAGLDALGLLYQPEGDGRVVTLNGRYDAAHSNGTSLALLTELHYFRASGDNRFADLRRSWLRGLLNNRIAGHGFKLAPAGIDEEGYANGEGWLALAYYHDTFPGDDAVAAELQDIEDFLIDKYTDTPDRHFHFWGAMAAAVRYDTSKDRKFVDFATSLAGVYLDRFARRTDPENNTCAIVEGLAAMARVMRAGGADAALRGRLESHMYELMDENRKLQIQPGQRHLDLGGDVRLSAPGLSKFAGAFLLGHYRPKTQVDLTQHCLSAMIKLRRLAPENSG